jgi:hypothetical protein
MGLLGYPDFVLTPSSKTVSFESATPGMVSVPAPSSLQAAVE